MSENEAWYYRLDLDNGEHRAVRVHLHDEGISYDVWRADENGGVLGGEPIRTFYEDPGDVKDRVLGTGGD